MKTLVSIEIPSADVPLFEAMRAKVSAETKKPVSNDALIGGILLAWLRMSRDYLEPQIPLKDFFDVKPDKVCRCGNPNCDGK